MGRGGDDGDSCLIGVWVCHKVREIEGGRDVLCDGVDGGGSGGIGRNDSLFSNVPTDNSLCRMFFCDVFQGFV